MTVNPAVHGSRFAVRGWLRTANCQLRTALAILAAIPLAAQPARVLEVDTDRVTARDLAKAFPQWQQLPASTEILYAPMPGLTRELPVAELDRLALRHGLETPPRPAEPLSLRRRMRPLPKREAEAAVAASVAERHRMSPEDVAIELAGYREASVPAGDVRFRSSVAVGRPGQVMAIPLTWVTADRRSGTLWLRGQVRLRGAWPQAARALAPNRPIEATDVIFREGELDQPRDRYPDAAEVAGRVLVRSVAAGEKILRSWLASAPAIERGALVELRLAAGGIEVRAPARAERAGAVGDRLPFRNLESGRRVTARLLNSRQAEVTADVAPQQGGRK